MVSRTPESSGTHTRLRRAFESSRRQAKRNRLWMRSWRESHKGMLAVRKFRMSWRARRLLAIWGLGSLLLVVQAVWATLSKNPVPKLVTGLLPLIAPYAAAGLAYIIFYIWR